jgi:hypothetical protein
VEVTYARPVSGSTAIPSGYSKPSGRVKAIVAGAIAASTGIDDVGSTVVTVVVLVVLVALVVESTAESVITVSVACVSDESGAATVPGTASVLAGVVALEESDPELQPARRIQLPSTYKAHRRMTTPSHVKVNRIPLCAECRTMASTRRPEEADLTLRTIFDPPTRLAA